MTKVRSKADMVNAYRRFHKPRYEELVERILSGCHSAAVKGYKTHTFKVDHLSKAGQGMVCEIVRGERLTCTLSSSTGELRLSGWGNMSG